MRRRRKLRILNEHMLPLKSYAGEKKPIYKETLHNLTLLDAQRQEGGAAEATEGLATNGQRVNYPK